ncbi:MAG: acylphosphatase [Erythrobacter sp.]|nr:acylphosphatase [Erythrobacter sp.]
MDATHLIIHGTVQGVFYRDWTVASARELGLTGWVRNLRDGTVEAHLEGDTQIIEAMIVRMHDGPSRAQVKHIEQAEADEQGLTTFERR